jgi:hypothetical protein
MKTIAYNLISVLSIQAETSVKVNGSTQSTAYVRIDSREKETIAYLHRNKGVVISDLLIQCENNAPLMLIEPKYVSHITDEGCLLYRIDCEKYVEL